MDDTGNPAAGSARADVILDADIPCLRCGYSLRTLGRAGVCPECGLTIAETLTIRGLGGDMGAWKDLHGSANNLAWMPLILVGLMAILFAAGLMVPSLRFLWGSVACIFVFGFLVLVVSSLGFIGTSAALLKAEGVRFAAGPIVFLAIAIIVPTALVSREWRPVWPEALVLAPPVLLLGLVLWTSGQCLRLLIALGEKRHLALARAAIWLGRASVAALLTGFVALVHPRVRAWAGPWQEVLIAALLLCGILLAVLQFALMLRIKAVSTRVLAIAEAMNAAAGVDAGPQVTDGSGCA